MCRTQKEKLTEIEIIENKELTKEMLEDKTGRIDVRAKTAKGEQINIKVQLTDQYNMDKRTLYYWGKLFLEGIKQGQDYAQLKKVITINLLDFNFLGTKDYHSLFHLWEDFEKDYLLSDLVEIHFIELPKFRSLPNKYFKDEALIRWLTFLEQDVQEDVLKELIKMDPAHERANLIHTGIQKGIEQGIQRRNIELAVNLLDVLDDQTISEKTGLPIERIQQLRNDSIK